MRYQILEAAPPYGGRCVECALRAERYEAVLLRVAKSVPFKFAVAHARCAGVVLKAGFNGRRKIRTGPAHFTVREPRLKKTPTSPIPLQYEAVGIPPSTGRCVCCTRLARPSSAVLLVQKSCRSTFAVAHERCAGVQVAKALREKRVLKGAPPLITIERAFPDITFARGKQ